MSLNWKEINLVLTELNLSGSQIQRVVQSAYDVLALHLYKEGKATTLLIALTPGACRLHATYRAVPKPDKPLRFAEFLKSRIVNGWITEAVQLGTDRVVRISIQRGDLRYRMYLRLWSNAANVIVTDDTGTILDVMRRSPRRGEITGGRYVPEETAASRPQREFEIRTFEGPGTFNEQIDAYYAEHGGALSLEALREQVRKLYEGRLGRLAASLERLQEKEAAYKKGNTLKEYGDILMANLYQIHQGDAWFEGINFYTDETVRIKLDPHKSPQANAEAYYEQYHKAKHGLKDVVEEIERGEAEQKRLEAELVKLLAEENPLRLHKALQKQRQVIKPEDKKRPGLTFLRKGWTLIVGRDATENDDLLRHYVKGSDLWLHARDYPGSYVFIKARPGKTVPLDILLDAGNLALFYSKGRNNGEGDLFYTAVKYLRRAKNGPKGLVLPTQERNLHVIIEESRLKELEQCRSDI
ncbi:NFACT RNA binding domain-containing protein [Gracilinema caldarium]|uniref:Rqc2 homolog RqcH n=1 Tax=Gracilinema caldarium (strain ATCC 51460 / DSM 7334 / H1) TaxID=744872 RepID=F8EXD0_GRAC1|nr:NFACT family protein [Gracilinema caldarium]AEJ19157.1 Fibronectin-binding A domain protein [Gracilinema caldarium DSM 7334]